MAETERPAASRIFISYRREDSTHVVRALLQHLRARFGRDRVFKDTDNIITDNIPPGHDFVTVIQRELESCSVLLAIIGKDWATVQDRSKRRRLDNPNDFLRLEVATARTCPGGPPEELSAEPPPCSRRPGGSRDQWPRVTGRCSSSTTSI